MGTALGIAIPGAVGAALASSSWSDRISGLPAALRGQAERLEPAVIGAQGDPIALAAGEGPCAGAIGSFVHWVHGAMIVAACLTFAAALTAFAGLRGTPAAAPAGAHDRRGGPPRLALDA